MGNDEIELYKLDKKCLGYKYTDNKKLGEFSCTERAEIKKHSENILDLIEIGDILEIEDYGDISYIGWDKDTTVLSYKDMIEDIKNGKVKLLGIVTRQQFNSIKYEV